MVRDAMQDGIKIIRINYPVIPVPLPFCVYLVQAKPALAGPCGKGWIRMIYPKA
jgi:hypothetical protein